MHEADHNEVADAASAASPDFNALIAALRTAGADQFDPVRLRYIEVLAKRAMAHQGSVKHLLDARLAQALSALKGRLEQAQAEAREIVTATAQHYPHATSDLQQHFAAGDFKGLKRCIDALQSTEQRATLGALVRQLEQQHAPANAEVRSTASTESRPELKTIRNFRNTWSKLSADKQVTQALEQAPKNAGPINSHMLVLRSLALMRDISPDYMNRFMSYADTLLCLDRGAKEKPGNPRNVHQVARPPKK